MNRRKFLTLFGLTATFPWLAHAVSQVPHKSFTPASERILPAEEDGWPKITLVACGGAGIAMTRHIDKVRYGLHKIIAIDTSRRSLNGAPDADQRIFLAWANNRKPRTIDETWLRTLQEREAITSAIGDAHMVIIVSGLGGAAGGGIANAIGHLAAGQVPVTFAFVTLPFDFESNQRLQDSRTAVQALKQNCENVCVLSHANLASVMPDDIALSDALQTASIGLEEYLWNTSGCLTRYGIVGIDFEDVRTALAQGRMPDQNPHSAIGWGEAKGAKRGTIACLSALNHPALRSGAMGIVSGISVSIRAAHRSLKVKDINAVMHTLKDELGDPNAHLIFSADYDDSLGDRLQVSILLNRLANYV